MTKYCRRPAGNQVLVFVWAFLILSMLAVVAAQATAPYVGRAAARDVAGGEPGFSLGITPTAQTVAQEETGVYTVSVNVRPTHTSAITLAVEQVLAGPELALDPSVVVTTSTVRLTARTSLTTAEGTWPLTVTAESDGISQMVHAALHVVAPKADFVLSVQPGEQKVFPGYEVTYTVCLTDLAGFASPVSLEVEDLPAGVESAMVPDSVIPPGEATLTLSTSRETPLGEQRLTVTGTSDNLTHDADVILTLVPVHLQLLPSVSRGYSSWCALGEPNDLTSQANPLAPYTQHVSYICPGDSVDFYVVSLPTLTPLTVNLTNLTNLPPGVDYDLYLLDGSGVAVASSNQYGQVNEQIVYSVPATGLYYIQVLAYSGSSREVPYQLTANFDYEPNDTLEQAYGGLQPGGVYPGYIWSAEDHADYYYMDISQAATLSIGLLNLVNLPSTVDYDLYLFDETGQYVAWSNQYGQVDEGLSYSVTDDKVGRYYVQVLPYSGFSSEIPYLLSLQLEP